MTFAARVSGHGTAPPPANGANTNFSGSVSNVSTTAASRTGSFTLNPDGSSSVGGSAGFSGSITNWYLPTTASVGTGYWARFTALSASNINFTGTFGSWIALSAAATVSGANSSTSLEGTGSVQVEIATTAAGGGAVVIGSVSFDVGTVV